MDYIWWLLFVVWIPLGYLWARNFAYLRKYTRTFRFVVVASLIFSIPWDILAVKADIWHYYTGHIVGLWIFGLPIEEYLYIVTVSILLATGTLLLKRTGAKSRA